MKNQQIKPENSQSNTPTARLIRAGAWHSPATQTGPGRYAAPDAGVYFPPVGPVKIGPFHEISRLAKDAGPFEFHHHPTLLALPGLVNAHAHLDLFLIGPKSHQGTFAQWLGMVATARRQSPFTPQDSVAAGLQAMRQGGICAVGDIAGTTQAARAFLESTTPGVAYLEALGFPQWRAAIASQNLRQKVRALQSLQHSCAAIGIEPHAPNTTNAHLYRRRHQPRGVRRCTHLAETLEEAQFLMDGTGPCRDLLLKFNRYDPTFIPPGVSPVQWLAQNVPSRWSDWLLVHCNYVSDDDIHCIAQKQASIAYCPIASEYFGHKNHRYREMLQAGVNVALGTDSAICQSPGSPDPAGLWAAVQRLFHRDKTNPALLIKMASANGAAALGLSAWHTRENPVTFVPFDPNSSDDPLVSALSQPSAPVSFHL